MTIAGSNFYLSLAQRPGKAELMAVGVGDVKKALAPGRVARCGIGQVAGGDQAGVEPLTSGS